MTQPYNLSVLRKIEEFDQKAFSQLLLCETTPTHLDVIIFGCTSNVSNPDGLYLYVDSLRAFCNNSFELSEVRFHLNCIDSFDRIYLLDMTAAAIDVYMKILLPFEDYRQVPSWYKAIILGYPAFGLIDSAVLNRKGLLKKTTVGAAALTGGALWKLITNIPVATTNTMVKLLRKNYKRIVTKIIQREINASFLEHTLIPRNPDAERPEYISFGDDFTSPQDPFPKSIFKGLLLLLADATIMPNSNEEPRISMTDICFYANTLQMTKHYHPDLLAISDEVLNSIRSIFRIP